MQGVTNAINPAPNPVRKIDQSDVALSLLFTSFVSAEAAAIFGLSASVTTESPAAAGSAPTASSTVDAESLSGSSVSTVAAWLPAAAITSVIADEIGSSPGGNHI